MKIDLSKFVKKQGPVLATKSCGGRGGCGGGHGGGHGGGGCGGGYGGGCGGGGNTD